MKREWSGQACMAAFCGAICLAQPAGAREHAQPQSQAAAVRPDPGAPPGPFLLATQSLDVKARASGAARTSTARSAASTGREQSTTSTGGRGGKPVHTALASGPAQPGYVHYFLLTLPDESLETLVGIEMPGRRIAWSFPDLGVVVAPFVENGVVPAGGKQYGVAHLYGIRPFPDEAAMSMLRAELPGRVERWVAAGTPYCENDGPRSTCMSCLGFVLRVLFPGRRSDFPDLPGDFWRALHAKSYSTEDLLLYLTGMLDLPNREARVKRLSQLGLPDVLRGDVLELVDTMEATQAVEQAGAAPQSAGQKAPAPGRPK